MPSAWTSKLSWMRDPDGNTVDLPQRQGRNNAEEVRKQQRRAYARRELSVPFLRMVHPPDVVPYLPPWM